MRPYDFILKIYSSLLCCMGVAKTKRCETWV